MVGAAAAEAHRPHPAAIGFLHTAESHVAAFRHLLRRHAPDVADLHLVRESPLAAHSTGGELDLPALRGHLESLTADGADVVVCTCSTLGAAAEQLGHEMGVAMVRIGRPMADAAVRAGCRIGVVIAAPSAVAPAREVLRTSAAAAGVDVHLTERLCPDAWAAFEIGDVGRYVRESRTQHGLWPRGRMRSCWRRPAWRVPHLY